MSSSIETIRALPDGGSIIVTGSHDHDCEHWVFERLNAAGELTYLAHGYKSEKECMMALARYLLLILSEREV